MQASYLACEKCRRTDAVAHSGTSNHTNALFIVAQEARASTLCVDKTTLGSDWFSASSGLICWSQLSCNLHRNDILFCDRNVIHRRPKCQDLHAAPKTFLSNADQKMRGVFL